MEQGLIYNIAVIGGGPAGCFCSYLLQDDFNVTVFEADEPLKTLLPTGGGRCNLAHYEFDFKELAKNYPRGEKFLYSVFSRFAAAETLEFFHNIGVDTFVQDDMRVFPISESSADVRAKFLNNLKRVKFVKEKVLRIDKDPLTIVTGQRTYVFDKIIVSIGGHSNFHIAENLGHNIIEPRPALTALNTVEDLSSLAGVSIKNAHACGMADDILFTHKGVSGPLVYKISSIKARENFPYQITFDLIPEIDLQERLNSNPHKSIKNLIAEFVPKSFSELILQKCGIDYDQKCHTIDGKTRDKILSTLHNFTVTITSPSRGGEVVTSGGVDLREINPKTMESRLVQGVYFCGEVMDIDGFCGGFNLQNCWSTAYCAASSIKNSRE